MCRDGLRDRFTVDKEEEFDRTKPKSTNHNLLFFTNPSCRRNIIYDDPRRSITREESTEETDFHGRLLSRIPAYSAPVHVHVCVLAFESTRVECMHVCVSGCTKANLII